MKNARITLWMNGRASSENSPNLTGDIELPCDLIAELYQLMMTNQYEEIGYDPKCAGFSLRVAAWTSNGSAENRKPVLTGYIDSKSEMNAYVQQRQADAQGVKADA